MEPQSTPEGRISSCGSATCQAPANLAVHTPVVKGSSPTCGSNHVGPRRRRGTTVTTNLYTVIRSLLANPALTYRDLLPGPTSSWW